MVSQNRSSQRNESSLFLSRNEIQEIYNREVLSLDAGHRRKGKEYIETHIITYLSEVEHTKKLQREYLEALDESIRSAPEWDPRRGADTFLTIEKFCHNILDKPWKSEYRKIKLYAGFYQVWIEPYLKKAEEVFVMFGYTRQGSQHLTYNRPLDTKHISFVACESFIAAIECKLMFSIIERAYQVYSIQDVYKSRVECSGGVVKCVKWITENCVPIVKESGQMEESWSSGNREGLPEGKLDNLEKRASSRSCEDLLVKQSRGRMPDLRRGDSADSDYRGYGRRRSRERSPLSRTRTEWAESKLAPILVHKPEKKTTERRETTPVKHDPHQTPIRPVRKSERGSSKKASRDSGYNSKPVSREMPENMSGDDNSIMPDELYGHHNHNHQQKEAGSTLSDFADALKTVTQGDDFDLYATGTLDDHLQRSLVAVEKISKSPKKEKPKPAQKGDEWGHVREKLRKDYGDEYFEGERGDILKNSKKSSSSTNSSLEPIRPARSKGLARRTLGDPQRMSESKKATAAANAKSESEKAKKTSSSVTTGKSDSEVLPPLPPKGQIKNNGSSFDSLDSGAMDPPVPPLRKSRVLRTKKKEAPNNKEATPGSSGTSSQANTPASQDSTPSPRNSTYLAPDLVTDSNKKLDPPKIEGVVLMKSKSRGSSPTYGSAFDPRMANNNYPEPRVGASKVANVGMHTYPDTRTQHSNHVYQEARILGNNHTHHHHHHGEPRLCAGHGHVFHDSRGNIIAYAEPHMGNHIYHTCPVHGHLLDHEHARMPENGPIIVRESLPPPGKPESAKIEVGIIRRPVRIPNSSSAPAVTSSVGLPPSHAADLTPKRRSYYDNLSEEDDSDEADIGLESPKSPTSKSLGSPNNPFIDNCSNGSTNTIVRAGKSSSILEDQFKSILLAKDKRSSFHYGQEIPAFTSFGKHEEMESERMMEMHAQHPGSGVATALEEDTEADTWPDIIEERASQISPSELNGGHASPPEPEQESHPVPGNNHDVEEGDDGIDVDDDDDDDDDDDRDILKESGEDLPPPPPPQEDNLSISIDGSLPPPPQEGILTLTEEEVEWQCVECTFANKCSQSVCQMCGKSRCVGSEKIPLTSGSPQCPACTYVNKTGAESCEVCSTDLRGSATFV